MIPIEIISLILLGIGTAAGYLLKDFLDRRKEAEHKLLADRREHYQNLILSLKSLAEGQRDNEKLLRFEYAFLWLNASDSVIRSFNRLLRRMHSENGSSNVAPEIGELVLAMRRDLGNHTRLSADEFKPPVN